MSIELINSIVNGDYVSANELFEEKLADIQEKKLYEVKRMIQSESEYSNKTKEALKKGYRLLTPDEREQNVKLGSADDSESSSSRNKFSSSKIRKLLRPGSTKTLDMEDRYKQSLSRAKDLESRGATGKVSKVKKMYRPYRVASAVGSALSRLAKGIADA